MGERALSQGEVGGQDRVMNGETRSQSCKEKRVERYAH